LRRIAIGGQPLRQRDQPRRHAIDEQHLGFGHRVQEAARHRGER
jgi:hypothetical protein